ncbi:MAG: RNA polymerase sigma factor SigJ [Actinomycetota bacterium]
MTRSTSRRADDPFAAERDRLFGLAYRMTGSVADAEDVVQEAWIRWDAADRSTIHTPAAWLTTVTSRLALDRLRSAQVRRERYVGPWLPEPLLTDDQPADVVEHAETLTLGFLCVLDRLDPRERAAFLLHDVFGHPFAEVAETLELSEANARQIASRARRRVRDDDRRGRSDRTDVDGLVEAFLAAAVAGEEDRLVELLAADVVVVSDGGPEQRAARRPIEGVERVVRFLVNISKRRPVGTEAVLTAVNGGPGLVVHRPGESPVVMAFEVDDGRIRTIRSMLNPDKVGHLARDG